MVVIINAEKAILGRLATYAAKKALLGDEVIVVNAEKAVVSGKPRKILKKELDVLKIKNIGNPRRGPFHQRRADRYVRRVIRGMLPTEKTRGREAFKRVMVYVGMPKNEIMKNHNTDPEKEKMESMTHDRIVEGLTVEEICNFISGKNVKGQ